MFVSDKKCDASIWGYKHVSISQSWRKWNKCTNYLYLYLLFSTKRENHKWNLIGRCEYDRFSWLIPDTCHTWTVQ